MSKAVKPEAPQKVDYNDAVAESKKYFDGDDLAATVWVSKYALKDSFGNIYETSPRQMHERIAAEIERIERKYPNPMSREEVFGLLDHFRYVIPQGGPMTGIGNNFQVASLSNCFVIGHKHPADSYGGIFRMDEEQVQLMKRRGGVGHDLSHIRPTGSPVLNSALTSTGIVPFMERYSNSTREVAQDGRRGALMLSLSIKHPDAERFIDAKVDTGKVTGANVSIKIDDEFMRAAIAGKKYHQQFPINSDNPRYEQDIDARKLWDKIIHNAWKSAEPGVLFWDTILRESVPDCYADEGFNTVSTNPCGEIPLCPYDSCRLLALNLYSYVDKPFTAEASFDFAKFRDHVGKAMRMMDDIIDLELEKVEQIIAKIDADPEEADIRYVESNLWKKVREMALKGRRTGLGITAEGDMIAALGMRYGSDEAVAFAVEVHKTLALAAYGASVEMAEERGAFPLYDAARELDNPMIARIREADPELYAEMEKGDVMLGGEESGGIGIPTHVMERDGLLMALLLAETMAQRGMSLGQLVDDMFEKVGKLEFERRGLSITEAQMAGFRANIVPGYAPDEVCGKKVVDRRDGVKFYLEGDAWVMMRPSGTEPLVRVYAEAETVDEVRALLDAAEAVVRA